MRTAIAIAIILAIASSVALVLVRRTPPDDRDQILSLLKEGERAIEAQDVRATMALVSPNYEDAYGNKRDDIWAYAIAYYRDADQLSITLSQPTIQLEGTHAQVDTIVTVDVRTKGSLSSTRMSLPVTLTLAKEHTRRFLIFPCARWRVTCVSVSPAIDDMWLF